MTAGKQRPRAFTPFNLSVLLIIAGMLSILTAPIMAGAQDAEPPPPAFIEIPISDEFTEDECLSQGGMVVEAPSGLICVLPTDNGGNPAEPGDLPVEDAPPEAQGGEAPPAEEAPPAQEAPPAIEVPARPPILVPTPAPIPGPVPGGGPIPVPFPTATPDISGPIPDGPPEFFEDQSTIFKFAIGDPATAPENWEFTVENTCSDATQTVLIPSAPTFTNGDQGDQQELFDVVAFDDAENPCSYTVTETPVDGWASRPGTVSWTPAFEFLPLIVFENRQAGFGQLFLAKSAFGDAAGLPDEVELTVSGPCLDATVVVTLATDGFGFFEQELATVPSVDDAGEPCIYAVELGEVEGFTAAENPVTVNMSEGRNFVQFQKIADNIDGGAIAINKAASAFEAEVPENWEFVIESPCLDEPLSVLMPTGPSLVGSDQLIVDGLPTFIADDGPPCFYIVSETAVDGWFPQPAMSVALESGIGQVYFFNEGIRPGEGAIGIFKYIVNGGVGSTTDVTISSACIPDDIVVEFDLTTTEDFEFVEGLPLLDDAGSPCVYEVTSAGVDGATEVTPLTQVVNLIDGGGFAEVTFAKARSVLSLAKLSFGDPANAPATFDFEVASDCLTTPLNVSVPAAASFIDPVYVDVDAPLTDVAGNPCTYTATELTTGYTALTDGPVTVDPLFGGTIFVSNIEIGAPLGVVQISKFAIGDPALAPANWEFTITSSCFAPITVTMPAADTFVEPGYLEVTDVVVNDADGFCDVTITETPVDGFAFLPPATRSFADGQHLVESFVKIDTSGGNTAPLTVLKYGFGDLEGAPETFDLLITSPCLDEPITVTIAAADILNTDSGAEVVLDDQLFALDGVLCLYSVELVPVEGYDQFVDFSTGILIPGEGGAVQVAKFEQGFFPEAPEVPEIPDFDQGDADEAAEEEAEDAVEDAASDASDTADDTADDTANEAANDADTSTPASGPAATATPMPTAVPGSSTTTGSGSGAGAAAAAPAVTSTGALATAGAVSFGGVTPSVAVTTAAATSPAASGTSAALALTGSELTFPLMFGLALIAAGASLMGATHGRRRT